MKDRLRLNKILAQHGLCSRRQADEWIAAGRVSVDGIVCREVGTQVDPLRQRVSVDGKPLENAPAKLYILLNKPKGYVSTRSDPQGRPIVLDLLPREIVKAGVFPVGRLDSDSEGLLLLTNDGNWSQLLLHPRHEVWKEYLVQTDKALTPELRNQLEQGVILEGKRTLPARIDWHTDSNSKRGTHFIMAIREGRNRQIRRMCKALGLSVLSLKRRKIGPISLGNLKIGSWRLLKDSELQLIDSLLSGLVEKDSAT